MKSIHFCTPDLLAKIRDPAVKSLTTIRTFMVPHFYEDEIVGWKDNNTKEIVCKAKIDNIIPDQFKFIKNEQYFQEEIKRYGRKFDDLHWFFIIILVKIEEELKDE